MTEAKKKSNTWIIVVVIAVIALPVLAIGGIVLAGGVVGFLTFQRARDAQVEARQETEEQMEAARAAEQAAEEEALRRAAEPPSAP